MSDISFCNGRELFMRCTSLSSISCVRDVAVLASRLSKAGCCGVGCKHRGAIRKASQPLQDIEHHAESHPAMDQAVILFAPARAIRADADVTERPIRRCTVVNDSADCSVDIADDSVNSKRVTHRLEASNTWVGSVRVKESH